MNIHTLVGHRSKDIARTLENKIHQSKVTKLTTLIRIFAYVCMHYALERKWNVIWIRVYKEPACFIGQAH